MATLSQIYRLKRRREPNNGVKTRSSQRLQKISKSLLPSDGEQDSELFEVIEKPRAKKRVGTATLTITATAVGDDKDETTRRKGGSSSRQSLRVQQQRENSSKKAKGSKQLRWTEAEKGEKQSTLQLSEKENKAEKSAVKSSQQKILGKEEEQPDEAEKGKRSVSKQARKAEDLIDSTCAAVTEKVPHELPFLKKTQSKSSGIKERLPLSDLRKKEPLFGLLPGTLDQLNEVDQPKRKTVSPKQRENGASKPRKEESYSILSGREEQFSDYSDDDYEEEFGGYVDVTEECRDYTDILFGGEEEEEEEEERSLFAPKKDAKKRSARSSKRSHRYGSFIPIETLGSQSKQKPQTDRIKLTKAKIKPEWANWQQSARSLLRADPFSDSQNLSSSSSAVPSTAKKSVKTKFELKPKPLSKPKPKTNTSEAEAEAVVSSKPPLSGRSRKQRKSMKSQSSQPTTSSSSVDYADGVRKQKSFLGPSLPLPLKYIRLYEHFKAMEVVMAFKLSGPRKSVYVIIDDLKQNVEKITKRAFKLSDLQRILRVLPEGYTTIYIKYEGRGIQKASYKLSVSLSNMGAASKHSNFMTTTQQFARRERFRNVLIRFVKTHYETFLKDHNLPILDDDVLTAWDPEFPLEEVPLPPKQVLPEPPKEKQENEIIEFARRGKGTQLEDKEVQRQLSEALGYSGDGDECDGSDKLIGISGAVKRAVKAGSLLNSQSSSSSSSSSMRQPSKPKSVSKSLRGLSPALLAKIRNKSATRKVLVANPEKRQKLKNLKALPYLITLVRETFQSCRKSAIPLGVLKKTLLERHRQITSRDIISTQLELLLQVAGFWCSLIGRNKDVFKVEMKTNVRSVKNAVEKEIEKIKSS